MRSLFFRSLFISLLFFMFMFDSGYSQLIDRKPGKVFEIEGMVTCRNFKNISGDKVGINVSVRSKSSRIEIQGVYMNNMAVTSEGADQYRKVFNFPNMRPGRSITIKIAYKDKHTNPPMIKIYTIARIKLDYFMTYIFPKINATIPVNTGTIPSLSMRKTLFRWSTTRTPHGASFSVTDRTDGREHRGESNVNSFTIPAGFLKKNRKYRIHNYVNLGFIRLQSMATSSSYLQFWYYYGHYFYTK